MRAPERPRRSRRWLGAALLAGAMSWPLATAIGCGGGVASQPVLGGESHFLARCAGSCGDGLDCIGGVCTTGCLVSDVASCSGFPGAACTADSVEPGAVAVCDVACMNDGDCRAVGDAHRCDAGYCRAPGAGGAAGGPGSGGSSSTSAGGSGSAAGGTGPVPDCDQYRNLYDPPESQAPVLELVVRNERSTPVYLPAVQESLCAGLPFRVERDGAAVDVTSGLCGSSCERVQDEGATQPGSTSTACPALCAVPPLSFLAPGQERSYRFDALEVVFREMPSACFSGAFASVTCFTRLPLAPAQYQVSLPGFSSYGCGPELTPCDCAPDANGVCTAGVTQGTGAALSATGSFIRPATPDTVEPPSTTVVVTFAE